MIKKVSAMDARKQLGRIMNEVSLRLDQYIIERGGEPLVAVIPFQQFQQWEEKKREFFEAVENIRAASKRSAPQEIEEEVAEALEKVRGKKGR